MSFPRIVTLFLVIAAGGAAAMAPVPAAQNKDASAEFSIPPEVKELLIKRRDTLIEIEKNIQQRRRAGTATPLESLEAAHDRLNAELELAESREARLKVLRKQIDVARKEELFWRQRQSVGRSNVLDLLRVRASRLGYEVDLAREKSKP